MRPRFHITGERNWINDPNGPIQHDGVHHLFYQANPHSPSWGPPEWGHVSSTDLVTWARHPPAIVPEPGTADSGGCWSGCARVVDGRPAIYYTADADGVQSVCRAWGSGDLLRWEKDAANPLIPGPPEGGCHRDPFLWQDDGGWHMLIGTGSPEGHGRIVRYDSADATEWHAGGTFFKAPRLVGGLDLGVLWECPHLVFDGNGVALVVSCAAPEADRPLMHAVSFVGELAGGRFQGRLAGRLDHGDVFYAPALSRDESGRALLWGWAQERLDPDREARLSHVGALTLPRVATLEGGRLGTRPAPELEALRAAEIPPGEVGRQAELLATFAGTTGTGGWSLGVVTLLVDFDARELRVSIGDSGRVLHAPLAAAERHTLRVFVDGSLIEAFADEAAITTRAYVDGGWEGARLTTTGDVQARDAAAWRLRDDVIERPPT